MTFVFFAFEKMYDNLIDSVLKNILGQSGVKDVGAIFLVFKKKKILFCGVISHQLGPLTPF